MVIDILRRGLSRILHRLGLVPPARLAETNTATANIIASEWDADSIRTAVGAPPDDTAPARDAWWAVFDAATADPTGPAPIETHRTHNDTTETLHAYLATCLDFSTPRQSGSDPTLSLGVAPSPTTSPTDESLDAPQAEFSVSQYNVTGRTIRFRVFLASQDANDIGDITEAGIIGPTGLWNHGVFDSGIDKTDTKVVTITVELSFEDVSEVGT